MTVRTSILIPSQLPEFIRDDPDYANFVAFIQAYYEWMEQSGNVLDFAKNIPSYMDVDNTTNQFMEYFANDFLQYFPQDTLISQSTAIKLARQLYQAKGTPASYQLLFRILYDSDFDVQYTKDSVLKASSGTWFTLKSLRLDTVDPNFLNIKNYRLFGQTSKSIATVENSTLSGDKTEVFISNIERLFQSGEIVTVVDNHNIPILINGEILSATLVGQISQININPNNRGLLYNPGDPVIVYGGLNPIIENPVGAVAEVGTTTLGSLQNIDISNGGYGYSLFPNTIIKITNGVGANAIVASLNPINGANVRVAIDTIGLQQNVKIGNTRYHFPNNVTANANTNLSSTLTFKNFTTYPIGSVLLINGGGGLTTVPQISAENTYNNDSGYQEDLSQLGILSPIQITNGGQGYHVNDIIVFNCDRGAGAAANVASVDANGAITSVKYVTVPGFGLGGLGYSGTNLPTLTVISANNLATGASLYVPGVLGTGASFTSTVNEIGSVTSINIIDPGEDYISAPSVSLRVQDILVSNTTVYNLPQKGDFVYQGLNANNYQYGAYVDSIKLVINNGVPTNSIYSLRVYEYNTQPNTSTNLIVNNKNISLKLANTGYSANALYSGSPTFNSFGVKNYGDGNALASASFLNGLVISQGQYLDTTGQLSSYNVLQSSNYNNYTYKITVEKEIAKYRRVLLDLLHPTGTKVIGRYALKSNANYNYSVSQTLFTGKTLQSYTGDHSSNVSIYSSFTKSSNNIIKFNNLAGANLSSFIFTGVSGKPNTIIEIIGPGNGPNVKSQVIGIDYIANTVTIDDKVWLSYANVAYASGNSKTNQINIKSVTNSFDIVNNGNYSNTSYPLMDIVYSGDKVSLGSNTYTVQSVDYIDGIIYTTSNVTSNIANSLISVNRTFNSSQVKIFGAIGLEYVPQLTTEDGTLITTEDGSILILE